MTDELYTALNLILDGQNKQLEIINQLQIHVTALENVLGQLDPRVPLLLATQIEIATDQLRETLQQTKQNLALLRATVSKLVQ